MKREKLLWAIVYVAVFIASAVIGAPLLTKLTTGDGGTSDIKWDDTVGTVQTDFSYGEGEFQKFDLYLPTDSTKNSYGMVVYIHGGGFTGGDKSGDADILKWATSKGYVAAGINYTLHVDGEPDTSLYNMSQEIQKGVAEAAKKSTELGYHVDKMAIGGGSAGSMLAMIYAFRDAETSPIPVTFCFQGAGPTLADPRDFGVCTEFETEEGATAALDFFNNFMGVEVSAEELKSGEYIEKIKPISPALLVNENTVPILFAHGKEDHIVIYRQAEYLLKALDENGTSYDFVEFERAGHGLNYQPREMRRFMNLLSDYLEKYMPNKAKMSN